MRHVAQRSHGGALRLRLCNAGVHGLNGPHWSQRRVRVESREGGQVGQHFHLRVGAGAAGVQVAYPRRQEGDSVVAVAAQVLLQHHVNHERGVALADAAGRQGRAGKLPQVVQRDGGQREVLRRRTRRRARP